MKVEALLRHKGDFVATIQPNRTVSEALAELAAHQVGALVVSSDGPAFEGIVSERDVVRHLHESGPELLDRLVASMMVTDVQTCVRDDELSSVMELMTSRRVRHVPVVDDGQLVGIVSIGDVVKARLDELEDDRRALHEYINAR